MDAVKWSRHTPNAFLFLKINISLPGSTHHQTKPLNKLTLNPGEPADEPEDAYWPFKPTGEPQLWAATHWLIEALLHWASSFWANWGGDRKHNALHYRHITRLFIHIRSTITPCHPTNHYTHAHLLNLQPLGLMFPPETRSPLQLTIPPSAIFLKGPHAFSVRSQNAVVSASSNFTFLKI